MVLKSASFMPTMAAGTVVTGDPATLVAPPVPGNMGSPDAVPDQGNANVGLPGLLASSADIPKLEGQ